MTLALVAARFAYPCEWTGGGADNNWSTPDNWAVDAIACPGGVPQGGETLVFPHAALQKTNVNDIANLTVGQIVFNGRDYDITGNPIDLEFGLVVNLGPPPGADLRIALDTTLVNDQIFEHIGVFSVVQFFGSIDLNGSQLTLVAATGDFNLSGNINGSGAVIKDGPSNVRLLGTASIYSGVTTVLEGILQVFTSNSLGASGPGNHTVIENGGAVSFSPTSSITVAESIEVQGTGPAGTGALQHITQFDTTLTGSIELTGPALIRNQVGDTNLTITGDISGIGALTKIGAGTLVLEGDNTHPRTFIEEGVVLVNGDQPFSEVEIHVVGLLGGTGTVGRVAAFDGSVSPGLSPGVLTTGELNLLSGSTFIVELDGPDPGTGHDQLVVSSPGEVNFMIPTLQASATFAPAPGTELVIIDNQGPNPVGGNFAGLTEGASLTIDGQEFVITYEGGDGNDVVLVAVGDQDGADLAIEKTATVHPDATVEFELAVFNLGPDDATGVSVVDELPACVELVSDDCGGAVNGDWSWDIGSLGAPPNGGAASCTITVDASACAGAGSQVNVATVSADQDDPDPENNTAEAEFEIEGVPALPLLAAVLLMIALSIAALRALRGAGEQDMVAGGGR